MAAHPASKCGAYRLKGSSQEVWKPDSGNTYVHFPVVQLVNKISRDQTV